VPDQKIHVVVKSGTAEVDEKTVPEGIEVVIIDLDVLLEDPSQFAEMPLEDQQYMATEYPEITDSIKEAAGLLNTDVVEEAVDES
jgi:hypothetical protein